MAITGILFLYWVQLTGGTLRAVRNHHGRLQQKIVCGRSPGELSRRSMPQARSYWLAPAACLRSSNEHAVLSYWEETPKSKRKGGRMLVIPHRPRSYGLHGIYLVK